MKTILGLLDTIKRQRQEIATLKAAYGSVLGLINDSDGVSGLHLNGDLATWEELREGGRNEGWLIDFDRAMDLYLKL